MMKDRTFFGLFQVLFFLTGVPFALILWAMLHLPWHRTVVVAIVAGTIIGLPLAYFLRAEEVKFAKNKDERAVFLPKLITILESLGYKVEHKLHNTITFTPTIMAGIVADRFIINIDNYDVMISGPKRHLDKVVRRLNKPI